MILVFDEHYIKVPLDIVREKVQVKVGLHPHVHAAYHPVQGDVRVDWDHFWRESGKNMSDLDGSCHDVHGLRVGSSTLQIRFSFNS